MTAAPDATSPASQVGDEYACPCECPEAKRIIADLQERLSSAAPIPAVQSGAVAWRWTESGTDTDGDPRIINGAFGDYEAALTLSRFDGSWSATINRGHGKLGFRTDDDARAYTERQVAALLQARLRSAAETMALYAAPQSATGAKAVIRGGQIVISIDVDDLPLIVSGSCAANGLHGLWKVTDAHEFAKEVCRTLNNEREDGTTRVHIMFDGAFDHAIDQGAEGIEPVTETEFEAEAAHLQEFAAFSGKEQG